MDGRRPAFARVHRTRPTGRLAPYKGAGLRLSGHRALLFRQSTRERGFDGAAAEVLGVGE